ncbi:hypothetical protein L2E82_10067 [Cichorium intybus]|uniref:Uncharacterized protein n=1 Tax=Cichorium intybus TaxID=13427 RepID=A0ACB9GBM7_CICIN|nr:hypothetical protein L2E82_10067 [Cichorium intybus]
MQMVPDLHRLSFGSPPDLLSIILIPCFNYTGFSPPLTGDSTTVKPIITDQRITEVPKIETAFQNKIDGIPQLRYEHLRSVIETNLLKVKQEGSLTAQ